MFKDGYHFPPAISENQNKLEGKHCEHLKKTTANIDLVIPHDIKSNPVAPPVQT